MAGLLSVRGGWRTGLPGTFSLPAADVVQHPTARAPALGEVMEIAW
jgi:hypothetical protein